MAKKKYTVQTPVRHDGKDYAPNDAIELDIPEDHFLLTDGVVADGKVVKAKAAKAETPEQPAPQEAPTAPETPVTDEEQGA
jgi:hypothetical protein